MSSDPSVPPEQPPETSAPVPDTVPPAPETAVKFTRTASVWSSLIVGFLILIVLLVFITQNLSDAPVHFFGWHWTLPLGVQVLLAAICGGLVTVLAGTARIFQLRRAAKKNLAAGLVTRR
ncbi:MAG: lipopolysaccharide assembly protein LapA domain-containing protein [Mycobacterium sp.]|uniref:LapA family protein n=1 Tax=Mycobacterium sp. TaxID=1785 RepID=UPI003C78862A